MEFMKKILSALILLGLVAFPAGQALAQFGGGGGGTTAPEPAPGWAQEINPLLNSIRTALWGAFAIFAIIMFVYAGFLFFTASGDPEKVANAKNAVIYGVFGIAAAIIGYAVVSIVGNILGAY